MKLLVTATAATLAASLASIAFVLPKSASADPQSTQLSARTARTFNAEQAVIKTSLRHRIAIHRAHTWYWQDKAHIKRWPTTYSERRASIHYMHRLVQLWRGRRLAARRAYRRAVVVNSDISAWLCIHSYEGAWNANTGNGFYGGLQMDYGFMGHYGPRVLGFKNAKEMFRARGTADRWTPAEQIQVARRARDSGRGYYPWPNTARYCGLI